MSDGYYGVSRTYEWETFKYVCKVVKFVMMILISVVAIIIIIAACKTSMGVIQEGYRACSKSSFVRPTARKNNVQQKMYAKRAKLNNMYK